MKRYELTTYASGPICKILGYGPQVIARRTYRWLWLARFMRYVHSGITPLSIWWSEVSVAKPKLRVIEGGKR